MMPVDLTPWLNAVVATFDHERPRGALNAWGNSFPAEEMPFGGELRLDGVAFQLPAKEPGQPDSVEPLGQVLEIPEVEAGGIALLCCGEMGDQRVTVRVLDPGRRLITEFVAIARGVMIPAGMDLDGEGFACSHLHYPGDYDLALALPAVWRCTQRWEGPSRAGRVELGSNPLFHILGITFLT